MTPELRSAVFKLPLIDESTGKPSSWLPEGQKREILSALQELFIKLSYIDERAISTGNLTKSFGWTGEEVIVQHDVQELSRVFFDCLDRALAGTEYSELIGKYCKGKFLNVTICTLCNTHSEREEVFADIGLKVKGCKDIYESLDYLVREDILEGSNQYFCDNCNSRVDALRITKIYKIPPLLTFSLNRFEYDMKTYERLKINQNFEFGLELNMEKYVENAGVYELFAVIIHFGNAHSGHYHAYIRDILGQGNWVPVLMPTSAPEPKKEKQNPKKSKKGRKNKRKQKNKKNENTEEKKFEFEDFMKDCENKELLKNWFDFNDSTITAIKSGKIQKQFGGSNETAYILIYRSTLLNDIELPSVSEYWKTSMENLNKYNKSRREEYENLKNWIELQIHDSSLLDFEDDIISYKDTATTPIKQGKSIKLRLDETIEDLKNLLTVNSIEDHPDFFNSHQVIISQPLSNKCAHLIRHLDSIENHLTIKEAKIWHKACLLALPRNDPKLEEILNYTGEACEPLSINCNFSGEKFPLLANKAWTIQKLKEKIFNKTGIPITLIDLKIRNPEGGEKKIKPRDEEKTLSELKFYHSIPLYIFTIEDSIPATEPQPNKLEEGLTTVLLNDENTIENPVQYVVNTQWKIRDLIDESRKVFNIDQEIPVRLRKLIDRKIVPKEDLDNYLKNIPEFLDGGYRFQVERGEPPSYGLIVVKVALDCESDPKELFVKETDRISEVKIKAGEVLNFPPDQYKLYRTDWLKEPISALKQENYTLFKAAVKDGDLLLARTADTVLDTEMLKLFIFVSHKDIPTDFNFATEISVPEETTLKVLKDMIADNEKINPNKKIHLRIRELTKTMWPGKIYKEENKTIKKLSISFGSTLLVQWLESPEVYSFTGVNLYVSERNTIEKKYENIVSGFFDPGACPNIDQLYVFALGLLKKDWAVTEITLAKFKSQNFEWEVLKDSRAPEEKGKLINSKGSGTAQGIFNLKKQPYLIKDGDLIAVRHDTDPGALEDNFSCETDQTSREEYLKRKQSIKKPKVARPEKSIKIGDF